MRGLYTISFFVILITSLFNIGCGSDGSDNSSITFNKDIAPIIHKNCTSCHRPGEAGPFALITFEDVRSKAKTIAKVVSKGLMPPWPADTTYSRFVGEKVLPMHEKQLLLDWIAQGCLEGDPKLKPDFPVFPSLSKLRAPDAVIKITQAIEIPGDNRDRFLVVKMPYELERDTFVSVIEYVPGNRRLSHHVNGHMVQYAETGKRNVFEGPFVVDRDVAGTLDSCYHAIKLLNDDGTYPLLVPSAFNYLPGVEVQQYPEGIGGYRISKKGVMLLRDVHYGPSSKHDVDTPRVNLFFAPKPPERPLLETQLGTLGISDIVPALVIPPDTIMRFTTRATIRQDISLVTINPHMHLLGKLFWAYAIKPDGDTIPLIRIQRWDFRWQYFYTFPKMLRIPSGSIVVAEGVFDNTTSNPNNPFNPPREITGTNGSMRTTDEMFQLIMNFLPYEPGDENINLDPAVFKNKGL
ncbi:MAG: monooxygenase [Arcticibacter sp.]